MAHYTDPNAPLSATSADKVQPAAILTLIAGVIAVLFVGLFYVQTASTKSATTTLDTTIATQDGQLKKLDDTAQRLTTYDNTAQGLHSLFNNQKHWDAVLGNVESVLYKKMKVTSLQVADTGAFTLSGTTPSYDDYAKVYAALTDANAQKYFKSLRVVSVGKSEQKGATDVVFTFQGTLSASTLAAGASN